MMQTNLTNTKTKAVTTKNVVLFENLTLFSVTEVVPISCGIRIALSCERQLANGIYTVPD